MQQHILFSLLHSELCDEALDVAVKNSITAEAMATIFEQSKRHDLAHMVGDFLNKNALLDAYPELKTSFLSEWNKAIFRYEQMQYDFEALCEVLENAQIEFLPLKGSVLRQYYPEPWMRTSCDIDVLIHPEELEKTIAVLQKELNYTRESESDHDISLFTESGVHIELHYQLLGGTENEREIEFLKNIWSHLEKMEGKQYHCVMPDEYFYCYHMEHIAKHLKGGGCGMRTVLDTWILNHRVEHDKAKRGALLKQAGLLTVAQAIENLAEGWFSNQEMDEKSQLLGEYIINGGLYGSLGNMVAVRSGQQHNKVLYLWSRLFLPFDVMRFKYPILKKYPILYPICSVKRWLKLMDKKARARALWELDKVTSGEVSEQEKVLQLMKDLDL